MIRYMYEEIYRQLKIANDHFDLIKENSTSKDWFKLDEEKKEVIYKIYTPIIIILLFVRELKITVTEKGEEEVNVIRLIREDEDIKNLIFTSGELKSGNLIVFENYVKDKIKLKDICNYFIHQDQGRTIWGHGEINGEIKKLDGQSMIYVGLSTDQKPLILINLEDLLEKIEKVKSKAHWYPPISV